MNRKPHRDALYRQVGVWLCCLAPVVGLCAGCVSKSKARSQAQAAFMAGQQQAMVRLQQTQVPSVKIVGPVANPSVPWTPGLTLVRALVAAEYQGATDPKEIIYIRNGLATRIQTQSLFNGHDVLLEAGDVIQLDIAGTNPVNSDQPPPQ